MKKILNLVGITDDRTVQKVSRGVEKLQRGRVANTRQVILSNTCWGFINAVPIALIAPRFPRRTMFLICTCGTAVVYTVWTIASARFEIEQNSVTAIPVLVFIFLYSPYVTLPRVAFLAIDLLQFLQHRVERSHLHLHGGDLPLPATI